MLIYRGIISFLAIICLLTGSLDFVFGLSSQAMLGALLSEASLRDPMADNVFRFFAGIWIGVGALLLFFLTDHDRYRPAMMGLLGAIALGGAGRLIAVAVNGLPSFWMGETIIYLGIFIELIVCPALVWWLARSGHPVSARNQETPNG